MKRTAAAGLLLLVCSGFAMADAVTATAIVAGIFTPRDQAVPFVEHRANSMLARPLELTGEVRFTSGGELVKTIEHPFEERIVISATAVRLERDGREQRLALDRDQGVQDFFLALRALLEGDHQTLARYFDVTTSRSGDEWRIDLAPRDDALRRYLEHMSVAGSGERISLIRTSQSEHDWQEMHFVDPAPR